MLYESLGFVDGEFPAGLGWHDKIVSGFPSSSLRELATHLELAPENLAEAIGFAFKDFEQSPDDQLLSSYVSGQLFNIARAYQRLIVPLKDPAQARAWLCTAQPTLGGHKPLGLLASNQSAKSVLAAIEAIKVVKTVAMNECLDESQEQDEGAQRDGSSEPVQGTADADEYAEL